MRAAAFFAPFHLPEPVHDKLSKDCALIFMSQPLPFLHPEEVYKINAVLNKNT